MTLINSIITTQFIYVVKVKFLPTVVLIVQYQSQSGGKISNFLQYNIYIYNYVGSLVVRVSSFYSLSK